jgi:hypothetical protein
MTLQPLPSEFPYPSVEKTQGRKEEGGKGRVVKAKELRLIMCRLQLPLCKVYLVLESMCRENKILESDVP